MVSSKYHLFHGCARVDPRLAPEKTDSERNSGCLLVIQSRLQKMLGRASGLNICIRIQLPTRKRYSTQPSSVFSAK